MLATPILRKAPGLCTFTSKHGISVFRQVFPVAPLQSVVVGRLPVDHFSFLSPCFVMQTYLGCKPSDCKNHLQHASLYGGWGGWGCVAAAHQHMQVFPGLLAKPEVGPASSSTVARPVKCASCSSNLSQLKSHTVSLKRNLAVPSVLHPYYWFGTCTPLLLVWRLLELDCPGISGRSRLLFRLELFQQGLPISLQKGLPISLKSLWLLQAVGGVQTGHWVASEGVGCVCLLSALCSGPTTSPSWVSLAAHEDARQCPRPKPVMPCVLQQASMVGTSVTQSTPNAAVTSHSLQLIVVGRERVD
jgi:hypothetical protein